VALLYDARMTPLPSPAAPDASPATAVRRPPSAAPDPIDPILRRLLLGYAGDRADVATAVTLAQHCAREAGVAPTPADYVQAVYSLRVWHQVLDLTPGQFRPWMELKGLADRHRVTERAAAIARDELTMANDLLDRLTETYQRLRHYARVGWVVAGGALGGVAMVPLAAGATPLTVAPVALLGLAIGVLAVRTRRLLASLPAEAAGEADAEGSADTSPDPLAETVAAVS
jgi:hypothetical protein